MTMTQILVHPLVEQKNQSNLKQLQSDLEVQLDYLEEEIVGRLMNNPNSKDVLVSFLKGIAKVKISLVISKGKTIYTLVVR